MSKKITFTERKKSALLIISTAMDAFRITKLFGEMDSGLNEMYLALKRAHKNIEGVRSNKKLKEQLLVNYKFFDVIKKNSIFKNK